MSVSKLLTFSFLGLLFFSLQVRANEGKYKYEASAHFIALDGNAGGISTLAGRFKIGIVELAVGGYYGIYLRKDFNEDSIFVPHIRFGVENLTTLSLGPSLNVRVFKLFGLHFGFRQDFYVRVYPIFHWAIGPELTLGLAAAF